MSGKEIVKNSLEEIKSKLGQYPTCPICSHNNWTVGEALGITGTYDPVSNNVNPASGVPSVSLICDNCSFIASFNPKKLGTL